MTTTTAQDAPTVHALINTLTTQQQVAMLAGYLQTAIRGCDHPDDLAENLARGGHTGDRHSGQTNPMCSYLRSALGWVVGVGFSGVWHEGEVVGLEVGMTSGFNRDHATVACPDLIRQFLADFDAGQYDHLVRVDPVVPYRPSRHEVYVTTLAAHLGRTFRGIGGGYACTTAELLPHEAVYAARYEELVSSYLAVGDYGARSARAEEVESAEFTAFCAADETDHAAQEFVLLLAAKAAQAAVRAGYRDIPTLGQALVRLTRAADRDAWSALWDETLPQRQEINQAGYRRDNTAAG